MTFDDAFHALTGNPPFPWQRALYERFLNAAFPQTCSLPTGLGKTSVLAIWLLAKAERRESIPTRLVYVVNRRTVVDQTTAEAEKLRANLANLPELAEKLGLSKERPLAISTLRGQHADKREWSNDPSRPAIICGTVDMIGSRLLFSGYGLGFKSRPLHAGFLGQDALLVHDEAHLEPAFQTLLESIVKEQARCKEFRRGRGRRRGQGVAIVKEQARSKEFRPLRVMELSATVRVKGSIGIDTSSVFELTPAESTPPADLPDPPTEPLHHVWRRHKAVKRLRFQPAVARTDLAKKLAAHALTKWKDSGKAILVFVETVKEVEVVVGALTAPKGGVPSDNVQQLTGTLRGLERDRMANPRHPAGCPVFARFLAKPRDNAPESERWRVTPLEGTVYLVCTSAGEVGVDLSADHLVCDLSTLDSMAQRFGRVNRRGDAENGSDIDVFVETDPPEKSKRDAARRRTKDILETELSSLGDGVLDASPSALGEAIRKLTDIRRREAFAPEPTILAATDILFDAWALTTIRDKLPGRPPVEPYLRGVEENDRPETEVAWRDDVDLLSEAYGADPKQLGEFLDDWPLRPRETLKMPTYRVLEELEAILDELAKLPDDKRPAARVWLLRRDGVECFGMAELLRRCQYKKDSFGIGGAKLLLPPSCGGLTELGTLDGSKPFAADVSYDVSAAALGDAGPQRWRGFDHNELPDKAMRLVAPPIDLSPDVEEDDESAVRRYWRWYELPREGGNTSRDPVSLEDHVKGVEETAKRIVNDLVFLSADIKQAVIVAAQFHDLGKDRRQFQNMVGNRNYPTVKWAKSGSSARRMPKESYRHEFGSLHDVRNEPEFLALSEAMRELVLHLIACHHGRARPHFPTDEAFDPDRTSAADAELAAEVPRRYARLQRQYGRWGLAYLESLLRAADWAASAHPSAFVAEGAQ